MANNDRPGRLESGNQPANAHRRRAERRPEIVNRRRDQRRQEFEKQKRNWLLIRAAAAVILVVLVLAAGWWGFRQFEEYQVRQDVDTYFSLDEYAADHREGELLYEQVPPVGGPHNSLWQNCGYYSQPIYNWHGVHSLEHGAVWITYDPELPDDEIDTLESLANQNYVLVSPYPGLQDPVVASVWGKQIRLDGANDDRLDAFIREYRVNPGNTPEPGALCSMNVDFTMDEGETPQTEPAIISGPPEEVAAAEADATMQAGGTPDADTPSAEGTAQANDNTPASAGTPVVSGSTPIATPE